MKKLPEQFKKDWVAALRSGEYIQVSDRLKEWTGEMDHSPVGYCCLGVACIVNRGVVPFDQDVPVNGLIDDEILEVFEQPVDPEVTEGGIRQFDQLQLKLASMNDKGVSFNDIATWIEENL